MSAFIRALGSDPVIIKRRTLSIGARGSLPYPDAYERRLKRQRIYNKRYYRKNRLKILKQKKEARG